MRLGRVEQVKNGHDHLPKLFGRQGLEKLVAIVRDVEREHCGS
jgi:hypothetical protein